MDGVVAEAQHISGFLGLQFVTYCATDSGTERHDAETENNESTNTASESKNYIWFNEG